MLSLMHILFILFSFERNLYNFLEETNFLVEWVLDSVSGLKCMTSAFMALNLDV